MRDVTPIARLLNEYEVIAVSATSRYQSLQQLIDDFKSNPGAMSWGGGSAGGTDHILVAMLAQAAGVNPTDINYVAYSGGGEAAVAVMGGSVTAGVSGYGEWQQYVESGRMRYLAVSSENRLEGDLTPTIRESGLDVVIANWRGVVAPPAIDEDSRNWVVTALTQMRESQAWQDILRSNHWDDSLLAGAELEKFIEEETATNTVILRAIGFEPDGGYAAVGPWVFPWMIGILLVVSSVGLFLTRTSGVSADLSQWQTLAGTALLLAGYFVLFEPVGYFLSTAAFITGEARLLGSRRWGRDLIVSLVLVGVIYAAFNGVLNKGLPAGIFG